MINKLDDIQIANRFNKAAKTYDTAAVLQQQVGKALLDRLKGIRCQPQAILDLGCGTGYFAAFLKKLYPTAKLIGLDKSIGMLKEAQLKENKYQLSDIYWIGGYAENLPFNDHSFELVYSNLMLHWSNDFSIRNNRSESHIKTYLIVSGTRRTMGYGVCTQLFGIFCYRNRLKNTLCTHRKWVGIVFQHIAKNEIFDTLLIILVGNSGSVM